MSYSKKDERLQALTEEWISGLLCECSRQQLTGEDVRTVLGATGRAMANIAAIYAPRNPQAAFEWAGLPEDAAGHAICISCAPALAIGDVVRAEIHSSGPNRTELCEGTVVDVVVGRYLAKGVTEVDYLLRYEECKEQWVSPGQVASVKAAEGWAAFGGETEL